ncbi:GumC family protein [uncultured Devosia sp.]|uniref:GumC family protein n=1 Tax=uncultured Devosia sp. TaxID=211434 RepID=UPI0026178825|nr:GumC family protein [uncultured Devosia sp.]
MTYEQPPMDDTRIDVAALLSAMVRRLPRILLITLVLLVATFVVLMFQPRMYSSSASILVEPRANAYVRASNEQVPTSSGSEVGVVSSQIELLKSRDTLLGVIDELDLRSVPEFNGMASGFSPIGMIMQIVGRRVATPNSIDETVLNALYDRLSVAQERDSRIISVTVSTTDPELSARVANAVASAHVARRAQLSISDTADATGWLRAEIDRLRSSVQEAESAVADFRVENDLFNGQNNTSLLDQQLSNISTQITAALERKNAALSRASLIRGLIERGQPIEGVADVQASVVIQRLSEEKARLQGEQAQLSATLLSNHPSIRALNAQIAELNNQIRIEGGRVAASLEAEAQIEADIADSLEAELARAKSSASVATRESVTLDSLEREAKAQRDLLEAYLLRFNEASSRVDTNSALPDVRVVSEAAPSVTPSSPKTALIMMGVGLVSFVLQVGALAFSELMSGRALVPVVRRPTSTDALDEAPFDAEELDPDQRWGIESAGSDKISAEGTDDLGPDGELVDPIEPFQGDEDLVISDPVDEHSAPRPASSTLQPSAVDQSEPAPEAARAFIRALMESSATAAATTPAEDDADEPVEILVANDEELEMAAPPEPPTDARVSDVVETNTKPLMGVVRYTDLVSDLILRRTHLLLLADHRSGQSSRLLAEQIVGDAISKGVSVALIDAGTGMRSHEPGISDLSSGAASFGDVVQKSADNGFAEVTWGQGAEIDRRSARPTTLVEALGDIYEVVVVLTGQVGGKSTLDMFIELGGRVVLVADDDGELDRAEEARRLLKDAGLTGVEITALAEPVAA